MPRSLYLIVLMTILLPLAFAGARVPLSLFAIHQGASPLMVGVLMSLLAIVPTVFSVLFGALGTALGRTPVFWTMAFALLAGGWYARRPH